MTIPVFVLFAEQPVLYIYFLMCVQDGM